MTREWLNVTPEEYHAHPAYGSGAMRRFILDPTEFYVVDVARTKQPDDSEPLRLGRDFHLAMEVGDEWKSWRIIPDKIQDDEVCREVNAGLKGNAKTLEPGAPIDTDYVGHRRYLEQHRAQAIADGVKCIDGRVAPMVQAVFDNFACRELLSESGTLQSEVTCILKLAEGVELKALLDILRPRGAIDFKTTRRRNRDDFLRDAFRKHGYQHQAGHYSLVTGKDEFHFVSITSSYPYIAHAYEVPRQKLKEWRELAEKHVEWLVQCMRMRLLDDTDSQGIPYSFLGEGWGAMQEFSDDFMRMA